MASRSCRPPVARSARRTVLAVYLSLLLVYGLEVALADGWHEQITKRGWTAWRVPTVLHPAVSWAWVAVLLLALLVWLVVRAWLRRPAAQSPAG